MLIELFSLRLGMSSDIWDALDEVKSTDGQQKWETKLHKDMLPITTCRVPFGLWALDLSVLSLCLCESEMLSTDHSRINTGS